MFQSAKSNKTAKWPKSYISLKFSTFNLAGEFYHFFFFLTENDVKLINFELTTVEKDSPYILPGICYLKETFPF